MSSDNNFNDGDEILMVLDYDDFRFLTGRKKGEEKKTSSLANTDKGQWYPESHKRIIETFCFSLLMQSLFREEKRKHCSLESQNKTPLLSSDFRHRL